MERLDLSRENLKKFGITMGVVLFALTVFVMLKNKHHILPIAALTALFFISGLFIPGALKPVYIFWMRLAFILSWINTRLVLIIIFYLIFTPFGLIVKLLGKDLLERKIEMSKSSYWKQKEKQAFDKSNYERQF